MGKQKRRRLSSRVILRGGSLLFFMYCHPPPDFARLTALRNAIGGNDSDEKLHLVFHFTRHRKFTKY